MEMSSETADIAEESVQPIDVLLVADDDTFNRLGSVVRHLCVGMIDEGVRMTVLLKPGCKRSSDTLGPSRLVRLSCRSWFQRSHTGQEVLDLAGPEQPGIVHCMSADLAGWVRGWMRDWASVVVVHMTDLYDVDRFRRLHSGVKTAGIATTARIGEAAVKRYPDLRDRIRVVPLGIPAQSEPTCYSRPGSVPSVVLSSPLTRNCGLDSILKALKKIVDSGRDVQLFILETGSQERAYRRQVNQLGLQSYVTFAGKMRDWATFGQALRGADIYIVPSTLRRFGIKTLTAMSAGMAILAPVGTIQDYLIDSETASLFDPVNTKQLAGKLTQLLEDRSFARQLAGKAFDWVRAHHQASMMVGGVAGFYRDICGSKVGGGKI